MTGGPPTRAQPALTPLRRVQIANLVDLVRWAATRDASRGDPSDRLAGAYSSCAWASSSRPADHSTAGLFELLELRPKLLSENTHHLRQLRDLLLQLHPTRYLRGEVGVTRREVGVTRREVGVTRREVGVTRREVGVTRGHPQGRRSATTAWDRCAGGQDRPARGRRGVERDL